MTDRQPLSSLAPDSENTRRAKMKNCDRKYVPDCETKCEPKCDDAVFDDQHYEHDSYGYGGYGGGYWAWYILIFIIIVVIVWLILSAFRPTWVQTTDENGDPTGELDAGKSILWAIIIALGICILLWILFALAWGGYGY